MNRHTWPPLSDDAYFTEAESVLGTEGAGLFASVDAMVFDADGVLTSGNLIYGPQGEALKEFHAHDGLGLVMARYAGIKRAVLTGRNSDIVACRAEELRFDAIKLGRFDKQKALAEIFDEIGATGETTLYMGDDLIDLPAMFQVAVPVAVPDAPEAVKQACCYTTSMAGGCGAVREVIDLVLKCRRLYGAALKDVVAGAWLPGQELNQ